MTTLLIFVVRELGEIACLASFVAMIAMGAKAFGA